MTTLTRAHFLAQADPPEGGLTGMVTDLMEKLGGPGAGLAVALENLFPPIPSEVILPLAGFTAAQGKMNLASAIIWTTIGSVVGALALYYIGAAFGRDRIRAIAAKLPLIKISDIDRTEAWFNRHGGKAVFFGRMIPIFRSLISVPAGVERMHVARFLLYTAAGSLIWNTTFVMAGYALGDNWHRVEEYAGVFQKIVIVVCALAVAWFVGSRILRRRRTAAALLVEPEAVPEPVPVPDGTGAPRGTLYGTPRSTPDDRG
ncbi:DedA family protein [Phytohabitans kaempferiae]|uniref:DedA family protein n=1 Tax=Phytohabitans kaempferiae TaxID=1620943 RepID=A0ABV6MBQ1_9ACTN